MRELKGTEACPVRVEGLPTVGDTSVIIDENDNDAILGPHIVEGRTSF